MLAKYRHKLASNNTLSLYICFCKPDELYKFDCTIDRRTVNTVFCSKFDSPSQIFRDKIFGNPKPGRFRSIFVNFLFLFAKICRIPELLYYFDAFFFTNSYVRFESTTQDSPSHSMEFA